MLWWTVQNLAVTALLAGLVALACRACRIGPVGRHALWLLVLVKMLTPPLVVWPWAVRAPTLISQTSISQTTATRPPPAGRAAAAAGPVVPPVVPQPTTQQATQQATRQAAQATTQPATQLAGELPGSGGAGASVATESAAGAGEESDPVDSSGAANSNGGTDDVATENAAGVPARLPARLPTDIAPSESATLPDVPSGLAARFHLERLLPWAGAAWAVGGLLFAFVQVVRVVRMALAVRRGRPARAGLRRRVQQHARQLGIRPVPVRILPGLVSSMIWAAARPRMLWPEALPTGAGDESVRGLILHELAHVKRRDHWVGWLELAAGCVWWWNPLFWYVRHQVRENAELACDAWVVQTLPDGRGAYARALLAVCERLAGLSELHNSNQSNSSNSSKQTAPMPAVGVGTGGRRFIERRLTMILRERVPLRLPRLGLLSVVLLAVAALPAWAQKVIENHKEAQTVTKAQAGSLDVTDEIPDGAAGSVGRVNVAPPTRSNTTDATTAATGVRDRLLGIATRRLRNAPLPDEAQQLLRQYEQQQAEARRQMEETIARQRQDLIDGLQKLQDRYTKAGQLDDAVAVRDEIRRLKTGGNSQVWQPRRFGPAPGPTTTRIRAAADPGTLIDYRGRVGEVLYFDVVGATDGIIWGTEVYTDDSNLATAAVHAGVVSAGQRGVVKVTILPALKHYEGSTANGVTSQDYGPWYGSYVVDSAGPVATPASRKPPGYGDYVGPRRNYAPPGASSSSGSGDTGTSDATAPKPAMPAAPADPYNPAAPPGDPGTLSGFRDHATGRTFTFQVVGSTEGTIWGDGVYTDDSPLATAAVHAGVLKPGQRGLVRVTVLPGRDSYEGATRNGVTSLPYGSFPGSYQVQAASRRGPYGPYGPVRLRRSSAAPGQSNAQSDGRTESEARTEESEKLEKP